MLVLSRKPGEKIHIGKDVTITLLEIQGNRVRIGIEAPDELPILRGELYEPKPLNRPFNVGKSR
jgi:carbon storage regulator